jgi:hypothetical protein
LPQYNFIGIRGDKKSKVKSSTIFYAKEEFGTIECNSFCCLQLLNPVVLMRENDSEPNLGRIIALNEKMDDSKSDSKDSPFGLYGTYNN